MESEDKKVIFTKRLILWILFIILIIIIVILLLHKCGPGNNDDIGNDVTITPISLSLTPKESKLIIATSASNKEIYWKMETDNCVTIERGSTKDSFVVTALEEECATKIIFYSDEDNEAECQVIVVKEYDELTGIKISSSSYTVAVGSSVLASVTPVPATAVLPELLYTIDNVGIAKVDSNGKITGVKVGTTKLTVTTLDGRYSATATVKVTAKSQNNDTPTPTAITLNEKSKTLNVGDSYTIKAKITPDKANQNITCTLKSGKEIVSLSNCTIKGLKAGTATVTVCSKANSKLCQEFTATVKSGGGADNVTASISGNGYLYPKNSLFLTASLSGATATGYSWYSSNTDCITVNGSGNKVEVYAKDGSTVCSATITVKISYSGGTKEATKTIYRILPEGTINIIIEQLGERGWTKWGNSASVIAYVTAPSGSKATLIR